MACSYVDTIDTDVVSSLDVGTLACHAPTGVTGRFAEAPGRPVHLYVVVLLPIQQDIRVVRRTAESQDRNSHWYWRSRPHCSPATRQPNAKSSSRPAQRLTSRSAQTWQRRTLECCQLSWGCSCGDEKLADWGGWDVPAAPNTPYSMLSLMRILLNAITLPMPKEPRREGNEPNRV